MNHILLINYQIFKKKHYFRTTKLVVLKSFEDIYILIIIN